jgi:hypothetical protein
MFRHDQSVPVWVLCKSVSISRTIRCVFNQTLPKLVEGLLRKLTPRKAINDVAVLGLVGVTKPENAENPMRRMDYVAYNLSPDATWSKLSKLAEQSYLSKKGLGVIRVRNLDATFWEVRSGVLHLMSVMSNG